MTDLDQLAGLAADTLDDICPATMTALGDDPAELRPLVEAILAEAAAERWIEKQMAETGIRAMDFRNGASMDLEPARELVAHWVGAARGLLGDAPNYSETKLEFDVKVAESPELYTIVVQRHALGALTPHEARQKAEAALADVMRMVTEFVVESNDCGGIDANDLASRLEQAGHPLPEDA